MTTLSQNLCIVNKLGLHARAAAKLVTLAARFESHIELTCEGKQANAKSIMSVMMLAASKGKHLEITVAGNDAEHALGDIAALISGGFGESE